MIKSFATSALAAMLAIGSMTATPARAEMNNLGKFLLGAGALAAVVYAIKEHQDDKDDRKSVVVHQKEVNVANVTRVPNATVREPQDRNQWQHRQSQQNVIRPGANRFPGAIETRHTLPKACERTFKVRDGKRTILPVPCLERNGVYAQNLPQACSRVVDIPGESQDRFGFGKECLKTNGYRIQ